MNVEQLIKELSNFPLDTKVFVNGVYISAMESQMMEIETGMSGLGPGHTIEELDSVRKIEDGIFLSYS